MKEIYLLSADERHKIHVNIWEPEEEIKAILQISHGMVEYIKRYEEFAKYLNKEGILVIGNDHLGHGKSVESQEELGYFCSGHRSKIVVEDLHHVTEYAKTNYGNMPFFLFGHSMGSFLARRYIMTYGKAVDGAIISGTAKYARYELKVGKICAAIIKKRNGEKYHSPFMQKLLFAKNNRKIEEPESENDWLTREKEIVRKYNKDPFCTFTFTINGYETLFDAITFIQKKENIKNIPQNLPLFFIAGQEDPIGNYGKSVSKVCAEYQKVGLKDVQLKIYENCRHELTNEINRKEIYRDIRLWIEEKMKEMELAEKPL